jgi:transketolase
MNELLHLSFKKKLSHIGSCLTCFPILENIYKNKKQNDIVVLSCGHAGVAQYVLIEKESNGLIKAENLLDTMGIHPTRDVTKGIHVSTGALGSGVLISVGLAIANKNRNVYCVLSDGECAEGYVWEALAFVKKQNIKNLIIHVNINGFSAYDSVDRIYLENRLKIFYPEIIVHQTKNPSYLNDLNAHYYILKDINEISCICKENIIL